MDGKDDGYGPYANTEVLTNKDISTLFFCMSVDQFILEDMML